MKDTNVKILDEENKGRYANNMQIAHTKEEFILDFMLIYETEGKIETGVVTNRVIVSPTHLKRISMAINDNIIKYENKNGEINLI